MASIDREVLQHVIDGAAEPILVLQIDQPDWPVVVVNAAFETIGGRNALGKPFADVIEAIVGRDVALDIAECVRAGQETGFPVEIDKNEYLLALKPVTPRDSPGARYYAVYWRGGASASHAAGSAMHQALLNAKRRLRDLARDDTVTGLLNERAFAEILEHDWAVARREQTSLAVAVFDIDDFTAYEQVFGRHAADTCLRRVGQSVRRFLRRASDVVARAGEARFCVLSHASEPHNVDEFAANIAAAVRELGLHHPRSSVARFVTVSYRVLRFDGGEDDLEAAEIVAEIVGDISHGPD